MVAGTPSQPQGVQPGPAVSSEEFLRHQCSRVRALEKQLSNGSRACARVERIRSAEQLDGGRQAAPACDALLRGTAVKMAAGAALALKAGGPTAEAGVYTRERIQVPRGNEGGMAELMDALKVANDLHKEGALSAAAYAEMCEGIQRKMDNLVCLWVPTRR